MLNRYKVFANIKPAGIFFCLSVFITFPLLANNPCKTKFPKSLTVTTDTIPSNRIDSFSVKKIIADTLKPADSISKNSTDTLIKDSSNQIAVDTLLFSKDSLDAPVNYTAEDSGVLIIPEKQFILYGKANTTFKDMKLDANTIKYDQKTNIVTAYGGTDTSTNNPLNLPTLTQAGSETKMDTAIINLKTQKGLTKIPTIKKVSFS
jgi:lipopolysaccharide assembly outer membrane protein LptD (OstA)